MNIDQYRVTANITENHILSNFDFSCHEIALKQKT